MCKDNLLKKRIHKRKEKIRKKKEFAQRKIRKQNLKNKRKATKKRNKRLHNIKGRMQEQVKYEVVKFPKNLYIEDSSEILIRKINEISSKNNVRFIFSAVKNISVSSALYIKAYVDSHKDLQDIKISCKESNLKMREILQHMELKNYGLKISHKDISCWTFRQWTKNNPENYAKIFMEEIFPKVLQDRVVSEMFSEIASGLHELLANCCEHAYTDGDVFTGYYFIAGEYENDNGRSNEFTFCIIDMGQGFRASLRKNTKFEKIKEMLGLKQDKDLIKAAVEGRFNANPNKNSGRGTGLPAVKEKVKLIDGVLKIYSDCGIFKFNKGEDSCKERNNPIIGSMITVSLPIK